MAEAPPIVALVGATATGKTPFAERLAERLDAEIVCADSRQVFRELEAGTGKPSPRERAARAHHLFEALALGERASAGWYARAAGEACAAIRARGRPVLLVGGSGLYVRALREGLSAEPPHDPDVRARIRDRLRLEGAPALHRALAAVDPETAARLAPADAQRIARALEVWEASGRPLSAWRALPGERGAAGPWRVLELIAPVATLDRRIAERTAAMFAHGLIEETRALVAAGHEAALRALRAVGYDEALELIAERLVRAEAEARTTLRTRQLAKRQRTWFRHQIEAVRIESPIVSGRMRIDEALAAIGGRGG